MSDQLQERILLGGVEGTGKTYAWLTIARALPDSKFYVIDPDDGVRRSWYKEFPEVKNIEYYFTPKWFSTDYDTFKKKGPQTKKLAGPSCYLAGVADAWKIIKPKVKVGDWVIIEHLGNLWAKIQDTFADEVFDKEIGNYFLEKRKLMKEGSKRLEALQGWTDWGVINKMHNDDLLIPICFENPGHVLMTTSVSIIQKGAEEDVDIKAFYGDSSIRYEGQKQNPFRAQTTLLMKYDITKKKYMMSTFRKDRARKFVEDEEWSDFFVDYLVLVAGWPL